jgi:hypothetical protein
MRPERVDAFFWVSVVLGTQTKNWISRSWGEARACENKAMRLSGGLVSVSDDSRQIMMGIELISYTKGTEFWDS